MQPVKRRENGLKVLGRDAKAQLMAWDEKLRVLIDDVKYKLQHLPQTNFELGKRFAEEGKPADAAFRFRMATYFAPNFTEAWYHLGNSLIAKGDKAKAIAALKRTLQLQPTHTDAKFMLATLDPNQLAAQDRPTRMPAHMVEGFFAAAAASYDIMEGANGYVAPLQVHARVSKALGTAAAHVLDVGCGTGLSAMPWRKEAKQLQGVDVVMPMVERARLAKLEGIAVFDAVQQMDANTPHATLPAGQDVVLAVNVLPFMGECAAFVTNAAKALKAGGVLAITVDPYAAANGFGVVPATSRFGHGVDYVRQLAAAAGLQPVLSEAVQMYEHNKAVLMVFAKPKA